MKTWKIIIIVLFLIGLFACVVIGNFNMVTTSSDEVSIYNGTGNGDGSFICKMTYDYGNHGVSDDFIIRLKTDGHWSANYENGIIKITNNDNKPIKHVSISLDGKEFGIEDNTTDTSNTGLFKIKYTNNYATIDLYN